MTLQKKLRIKEGQKIILVNPPPAFSKKLGNLPAGSEISEDLKGKADLILLFVKNSGEVNKYFRKVFGLLKPKGMMWTAYPKKTSGMQTDLSRDHGWDQIMEIPDMQWISMIALDETWSAFATRFQPGYKAGEKVKEKKENAEEEYINMKTRIITVPDELEKRFRKEKSAAEFYHSLSFTNRREYIRWIVTAKRPETREERLKKTIQKLKEKKKNPADKG